MIPSHTGFRVSFNTENVKVEKDLAGLVSTPHGPLARDVGGVLVRVVGGHYHSSSSSCFVHKTVCSMLVFDFIRRSVL